MVGSRRLAGAAAWTRDAAAIYLAVVMLMWLSQRLVAHLGVWIPGATVAIFVYATRQLALRRYTQPQDRTEKRLAWIVLGCGVAGIALVVELIIALRGDFEPGFLLGALLVPYACAVVFYRRRVLDRFDLEWIRRIVHARFEEIGDSTEHGQSLQGLEARINEQVDRWQP